MYIRIFLLQKAKAKITHLISRKLKVKKELQLLAAFARKETYTDCTINIELELKIVKPHDRP